MSTERLRIVLGAVISLAPFSAGMAWNWLQLAVGLRRLGHDVVYLEELDPAWCADRLGRPCSPRASLNRALFLTAMRRFGLDGSAWQVDRAGQPLTGRPDRLHRRLAGADLLINMAGHVRAGPVLDRVRRRVYVDQDPVYTQLWHAAYGKDLGFDRHDVFATVGLNLGTPASAVPSCGIGWLHLLPAVVPDLWPAPDRAPHPPAGRMSHPAAGRPFTTIASWESFGDLVHDGRWYRGKRASFARLADLPRRVPGQRLELALRRHHPADAALARRHGWRVREATRVAGDLDSYQRYLTGSRAEIGVAKQAYATARSGWFSDRSAHYLAAGRPVVAQATGAEEHLPTGAGLLVFDTAAGAAAAIEAVNGGYRAHCRAARELAADLLGYRTVLPPFLRACLS
jgi:hypothetical protein